MKMKIDFEKIMREFKSKADSIFKDNSKLSNLLIKTRDILNENKELDSIISEVKLFIQLIKDYKNGDYREISRNSIIMIIISLIYLVNPIDLIPDFLIGGFIDDAAVIAYVLKKIQIELNYYREWKNDIIIEEDTIVVEDDIVDQDGYFDIEI